MTAEPIPDDGDGSETGGRRRFRAGEATTSWWAAAQLILSDIDCNEAGNRGASSRRRGRQRGSRGARSQRRRRKQGGCGGGATAKSVRRRQREGIEAGRFSAMATATGWVAAEPAPGDGDDSEVVDVLDPVDGGSSEVDADPIRAKAEASCRPWSRRGGAVVEETSKGPKVLASAIHVLLGEPRFGRRATGGPHAGSVENRHPRPHAAGVSLTPPCRACIYGAVTNAQSQSADQVLLQRPNSACASSARNLCCAVVITMTSHETNELDMGLPSGLIRTASIAASGRSNV